jgi:hypothetical protein
MLYPEKTPENLETEYHLMTAALIFAAIEKYPRDIEAAYKQVDQWLKNSEGMAAKSAVIRRRRNAMKTPTETVN